MVKIEVSQKIHVCELTSEAFQNDVLSECRALPIYFNQSTFLKPVQCNFILEIFFIGLGLFWVQSGRNQNFWSPLGLEPWSSGYGRRLTF